MMLLRPLRKVTCLALALLVVVPLAADEASRQAAEFTATIRQQMEQNKPLWTSSDISQLASAVAAGVEPVFRRQHPGDVQCRDLAQTFCQWLFHSFHLYMMPDRSYLPTIVRIARGKAVALLCGKSPSPETASQIRKQMGTLAEALGETLRAKAPSVRPEAIAPEALDEAISQACASFVEKAMQISGDPSELGLKAPLSLDDLAYLKGRFPGFADDTLQLMYPEARSATVNALLLGIAKRAAMDADRRTSPTAQLREAMADIDMSKGPAQNASCAGGPEVVRIEQMQFLLAPALQMLAVLNQHPPTAKTPPEGGPRAGK